MLVDGDDELIGKYPFQLMNSAFQGNKEKWIAYSGYLSTQFKRGMSYPLTR